MLAKDRAARAAPVNAMTSATFVARSPSPASPDIGACADTPRAGKLAAKRTEGVFPSGSLSARQKTHQKDRATRVAHRYALTSATFVARSFIPGGALAKSGDLSEFGRSPSVPLGQIPRGRGSNQQIGRVTLRRHKICCGGRANVEPAANQFQGLIQLLLKLYKLQAFCRPAV